MKAQSIMSHFPFDQQLEFLRGRLSTELDAHISVISGNQKHASTAIIGLIEVLGSLSDKVLLSESWKLHLPASDGRASSLGGRDSGGIDENNERKKSLLPRYAMALKEYGDVHGTRPEYRETMVHLDPPLFFCRLRFEGLEFMSRASSKKQARHYTARQACDALSVRL